MTVSDQALVWTYCDPWERTEPSISALSAYGPIMMVIRSNRSDASTLTIQRQSRDKNIKSTTSKDTVGQRFVGLIFIPKHSHYAALSPPPLPTSSSRPQASSGPRASSLCCPITTAVERRYRLLRSVTTILRRYILREATRRVIQVRDRQHLRCDIATNQRSHSPSCHRHPLPSPLFARRGRSYNDAVGMHSEDVYAWPKEGGKAVTAGR